MAFDEKIVRASTSKNLRHLERPCDVDVLGASGMAAANQGLGHWAFRVKFLREPSILHRLRDRVRAMVVGRARTRRIRAKVGVLHSIADAAVAWWVNDICPRCKGVQFEKAGQTLSTRACHTCRGTGKRREPTAKDIKADLTPERFEAVFGDAVTRLEEACTEYRSAVVKRYR